MALLFLNRGNTIKARKTSYSLTFQGSQAISPRQVKLTSSWRFPMDLQTLPSLILPTAKTVQASTVCVSYNLTLPRYIFIGSCFLHLCHGRVQHPGTGQLFSTDASSPGGAYSLLTTLFSSLSNFIPFPLPSASSPAENLIIRMA